MDMLKAENPQTEALKEKTGRYLENLQIVVDT